MTNAIKVMMVDDEPLIRKAVALEMNSRQAQIECSPDGITSQMRSVEMMATYGSGAETLSAIEAASTKPDYLLVDMEFRGEPTAGLVITRHVHQRWPQIRIIIFSGRFDLQPSTTASPLSPTPTASTYDSPTLHSIGHVLTEALASGASAFVSKNAAGGFSVENIIRAIVCLERGEQFYFNYPVILTLKAAAERYFAMMGNNTIGADLTDTERSLLLLEAAGCTASEISSQLHLSDKAVQNMQKELSTRLDIVNKSAARVAKAISLGLLDPSQVHFLNH